MMKRRFSHFLQQSFSDFAPLFTALCLSLVGFEAAAQDSKAGEKENTADKAKETTVKAAPALIGPEETAARTAEQRALLDKASKINALIQEKDYEGAVSLAEQALAEISKMTPVMYVQELETKILLQKRTAQSIAADNYLRDAYAAYRSANTVSDLPERMKSLAKVVESANAALAVKYLGIFPGGQKVDEEALDAAIGKDPKFANTVSELLARTKKLQQDYDIRSKTTLDAVDPNYQDRQEQIQRLLVEGRKLFAQKLFTDARDKMEQILILDPYNTMATAELSKIYEKLYFYAEFRLYNEFLRETAETQWRWVNPVPPDKRIVITEAPKAHNSGREAIIKKLNDIRIDLEVDDTNIASVLSLIRRKSREADEVETDESLKGINMISALSQQDAADIRVSLNLKNVPLYNVLDYVCKVATNPQKQPLIFRVKDNAVVFGTSNIDDFESRDFVVRYSTITRILDADEEGDNVAVGGGDMAGDVPAFGRPAASTSRSSSSSSGERKSTKSVTDKKDSFTDLGSNSGAGADSFSSALDGEIDFGKNRVATPEILRNYFFNRGIPFPTGSSIAYDAENNTLTVTNTPENLRKLEDLVRKIDILNPLVLVEAKILEIKMSDMEELGFDWLLTHGDDGNANWDFVISSPVRSSTLTNNVLINNMNILPNFGGDNLWSLFLTVNAIDRTDRAEVLSTPKITTLSGKTAEIRFVKEMYFPDEWTEPEINTSCGTSISYTPSYPEFGDSTDIGITFVVTPLVMPNNYTIQLNLEPTVTDLIGWTDYSYEIVLGSFSSKGGSTSSTKNDSYPVKVIEPEISKRQISTTVKVYDGQTVILGGMLNEKASQTDDKWPLLGDIPLIGRLFSMNSNVTEKSNLMITVTPRLVGGDGIPLRSSIGNSIPDFRR